MRYHCVTRGKDIMGDVGVRHNGDIPERNKEDTSLWYIKERHEGRIRGKRPG